MDLTALTIQESADLLAAGKATSLDLVEAYLGRIKAIDAKLNSFLAVWTDSARETAKAADTRRQAKKSMGPLDGIPIALKDNLSTKGQVTTAGSQILKDYRPLYSATVVRKLNAAGAIILGKTNLDEFAMGSSTENSAYGVTKNPWDMERVAGGSSGGSAAAVAADLCAGALGSDTGGSIRQPASFCGVVGFKPTYGAVSRYGLLAMASSFDQIGPLTKSVADARLLFDVIAGPDRFVGDGSLLQEKIRKKNNSTNQQEKKRTVPFSVGIPEEFFGAGLDPAVEKIVRAAIDQLKQLGATIKPVSLPHVPLALAVYYIIVPVEVASNLARYDGIRYGASIERQEDHKRVEQPTEQTGHTSQSPLLEVYRQTRARYLGAEAKRRIMLGTYVSSAGYSEAYYHQALKVQSLIRQEFDKVFQEVDYLVTPVTPTPAFKIGAKAKDPLAMYLADINTVPVNVAGLPAISVPAGQVDGLPVGLQLIGPRLSDYALLDVAEAFEQTVAKQKPNI